MADKKLPWQAPLVRSLDDLSIAFGACAQGGSQATGCATGKSFNNPQWCSSGSTANANCGSGGSK